MFAKQKKKKESKNNYCPPPKNLVEKAQENIGFLLLKSTKIPIFSCKIVSLQNIRKERKNRMKPPQKPASRFLKHIVRNWPNPDYSFYAFPQTPPPTNQLTRSRFHRPRRNEQHETNNLSLSLSFSLSPSRGVVLTDLQSSI